MEKQHIYDIVSESIENKIPSVTVLFRDPFDVSKTFSCGQTFRFRDSSTDVMNIVRCTANGKQVNIFQNKLNGLTKFEGVDLVEFDDSDRWEAEVVAVEGNLSSIRSYLE